MKRLYTSPLTALAVIIVLVLLFFYQLAFTDLILARGDTFVYFYPYWDARDAALAAGELPLWTPDLYMGAPLLANPQIGALYPPNWLTIPLNAPDSIRVSVLLHVTWATLGVYWLARRAVMLSALPALIAALIFGLGGYTGAHVEQINQLQGLAWMPWLFLLLHLALRRPSRYLPLMGAAWALQLLSGHTQTVFISGVGLGIYTLVWVITERRSASLAYLRPFALILVAGIIGVMLAAPQLIPTQELIALSNRGDGLNAQEATAFSLPPTLIGRGLLPSYDAQPFTEYVGYLGVIGLGLAVIGAFSAGRRRWPWVALLVVGVVFALGRYTPVYLLLAELPGFNLFRVPARWLALFTLGGALLAGLGVQALQTRHASWRAVVVALVAISLLMASTLLADRAADEIDGSALPETITWVVWGVTLVVFAGTTIRSSGAVATSVLLVALVVELFFAAQNLPHSDLTDPDVYTDRRFVVNQMQAYTEDATAPGRLLSITGLLFDPGDKDTLQTRWAAMGINERAARYAFTATKIQETLTGNLPLTWGIATIDGFGGGILPTLYYTQFASLLLPEDTPRTPDGRLREVLAQPACRGACIPADRWLDLTGTRYLLLDKVYDVVREGIFYDTGLTFPASATLANPTAFEADALDVLYTGATTQAPSVTFDETPLTDAQTFTVDDTLSGYRLTTADALRPDAIRVTSPDAQPVAVSLVDTRTGAFVQLTPPGWARAYSADVKLYENLDVLPRAFVVSEAQTFPDTWAGTEAALDAMRDPTFDPRRQITLNTDDQITTVATTATSSDSAARVMRHISTEVTVEVETAAAGWLVLTDAYYPGWEASTTAGEVLPVYRAGVMFRAVPIEAGAQTITFTYASWTTSPALLMVGAGLWGMLAIITFVAFRRSSPGDEDMLR